MKKELARDLASFANDGGALLLGVAEDKAARTLQVNPVPLAGLAERVDQVAGSRCDPPLYVVCRPLTEETGRASGVLLVEIPASASAPHVVEGGRAVWTANAAAARRLTAIGYAAARSRSAAGISGSRIHLVIQTETGCLLACPPQRLYPVDRDSSDRGPTDVPSLSGCLRAVEPF